MRRSICTAPTAARRARSPPTACLPAGWPSAAFDSSSSIIKAGTTTAACRPASATSAHETDQASAALVMDLKQRGMLDDTLVVWGGEFGRTSYSQGALTADRLRPRSSPALLHDLARRRRRQTGHHLRPHRRLRLQHRRRATATRSHPTKHEITPGAVHVHDLQATILHLLGIDHTQLTFKYQGRHYRLTDVHGHVVNDILS